MALLGCSCSSAPSQGSFLSPPVTTDHWGEAWGVPTRQLGEPLYFWLRERVELAGSSEPPVHLLKAEFLGLPSFVVVDRVVLRRVPRQVPQHDIGDMNPPESGSGIADEHYFGPWTPMTDVTLRQLCLGGGNAVCPGWSLIGQVHMTKMKAWKSKGVRITYEVNGHTYYQDYFDIVVYALPFGMNVNSPDDIKN